MQKSLIAAETRLELGAVCELCYCSYCSGNIERNLGTFDATVQLSRDSITEPGL